MRKFIYIGLLATLGFSSCEKNFLERPPQNDVSETTFWTSPQEVYLAVNAIYADLPGDGVMYEDAATDIAHGQYTWESKATAVAAGTVNTSLDAGWSYVDKRKANYFLENVDKATMDEKLKERYKAEVRFLRAFSYYTMMSNFGDIPLVTTVLEIKEEVLNIKRTPKAQVLDFILNELTEVAKVLPESYVGGKFNEKGRVTKGAALAFKSRVLLNEGQYELAAAVAREVMGMGYSLFNAGEESERDLKDDYSKFVDFKDATDEQKFRAALRSYEGIFHEVNEGNSEVILDRQYIVQSQANYYNTFLMDAATGGWSSIAPTQDLVDAYEVYQTGERVKSPTLEQRANYFKNDAAKFVEEYKNRDPRFYATISFKDAPWNALTEVGGYKYDWRGSGNNVSKTGYGFRKFVDPAASRAELDNYSNAVLIRYAEVLLNFAEAQNEAFGPSAEVYDAIDKIRKRAAMPVLDRSKLGSKDALREAIRHERMVELALEGRRYLDIRRWKIAPDVMKDIYGVNGDIAQRRVWSDKLYLMPVPQKQIDLSYGVLEQNLGY